MLRHARTASSEVAEFDVEVRVGEVLFHQGGSQRARRPIEVVERRADHPGVSGARVSSAVERVAEPELQMPAQAPVEAQDLGRLLLDAEQGAFRLL